MKSILKLLPLLLFVTNASAQNSAFTGGSFITNGAATDIGGGVVRLTQSGSAVQTGTFFSTQKVDLTQSFDVSFQMFFGCDNSASGGDGMTFVLQNDPRGTAAMGKGFGELGYSGTSKIKPSIAIEFDTYNGSATDIDDDHTALLKNGDVLTHFPSPVSIGADLEDCKAMESDYWIMRMVWNAATKQLSQYIDGKLKFSYTEDFLNTIFGGNKMVHWGFTGATGNASNEQWISPIGSIIPWECKSNSCCTSYSFNITGPTKICGGGAVTLGTSTPFSKYKWTSTTAGGIAGSADGATITVTKPGTYTVSVIQNQSGANCPSSATVQILEIPLLKVTDNTYCNSSAALAVIGDGSYEWYDAAVGGALVGTGKTFNTPVLPGGTGTKIYYVKDVTTGSFTAGGKSSAFGTNNYNGTEYYADAANTNLKFTAASNMIINSLDVVVNFWPVCTNAALAVNLKDGSGTIVQSYSKTVTCPGSPPYEKTVKLDVNFPLVAGQSYQLEYAGATYPLATYPWLANYPIVQNKITLTGASTATSFPAFFNWNVSLGFGFGCMTPVQALQNCPPCVTPLNPSISPINSSFCGSGSQLLTASVSNTAATTFVYTFYKKGTPDIVVQTQSTKNTYTATAAGTYYAVIADQSSPAICKVNTSDAVLNINSFALIDAGKNDSICIGESATLTALGGVSYVWDNGLGAGQTQIVSPIITTRYTVTGTDATSCTGTDYVDITVVPLDVANFTVSDYCDYSTATMPAAGVAFTAGGTYSIIDPVQLNGASINSANGVITNGKGGTSYTVQYTTKGYCAATSTAVVKVNTSPVITAQPENSNICGGTTSFNVIATGGTIYQWQVSSSGSNFINVVNNATYSGATTNKLELSGVGLAMNGYKYRAIIFMGLCSVTTTEAELIVKTVTSATDPKDLTTCSGTNGSFTVVPTGVKTIEWQYSTDNGANYEAVPNAAPYSNVTNPTLLITGITANMNGYLYRCYVKGCLLDATTNSAKLTLFNSPTITTDPSDVKVCSATATSFSIVSPDATSYAWEISTNGGSTFTSISANGAVFNILKTAMSMDNYRYRAIAKGNCAPTVSKTATLTVDTTIVSITVSKPVVCTGDSSEFTAVSSPANATYFWSTGSNGSTVEVDDNSLYTVVATANNCASAPASKSIKVVAKPEVYAGEDTVVCAGTAVQLGVQSKEGHNYSWTADPKGSFDSSSNPKVTITENVIYIVTATIAECPDAVSDTVIYTTIEGSSLYVPNAFTPNDDGVNDVFKVEAIGLIEFEAVIFNRWGQEIYKWNDVADGWNGMKYNGSNLSQEDVYVYKITSRNLCDKNKVQNVGSVTVFR